MFASEVYAKLVRSLAPHRLTSAGRQSSFAWLLPCPDATAEQLAILKRLYTAGITVMVDELKQIYNLKESTITSEAGYETCHYFYIREFILTHEQLLQLIEHMSDGEADCDETAEWQKILNTQQHSGSHGFDKFSLRYLGMVEGPERPYDHLNADLKDSSSSNMFGEVYQAIGELFPDIFDQAKVHTLVDSTIDLSMELLETDHEPMLLAMFHLPTLVNRRRDSFYPGFTPSQPDLDRFAEFETDVWSRFRKECEGPSDKMSQALEAHFDEMHLYASTNPAETGTHTHDFTDARANSTMTQGTPRQYKQYTLTVFLCKGVALSDYMREKSFWNGGSRGGLLTKELLQRIVEGEAQSNGRNGPHYTLRPEGSIWCYADFWPWLWHKDEPPASDLLRSYLSIVRPLVTISYSRIVNAHVMADFADKKEIGMSTFAETIGDITIQYYNDPSKAMSAQDRENSAFLNISHIDPNRDKASDHDVRLRRLLDVSMMKTFVVLDVAMSVIDRHSRDEHAPTRLQLCREISEEVDRLRCESEEHQTFFAAFEDARRSCVAYLLGQK